MKRSLIFASRNIKEILRDPLSLVFLLALPFIMLILFYFLFNGLTSQFEIKYFAPGIVVFSYSFITLFNGLLISMDRSSSFLIRLYSSPIKSWEFIFGYSISMIPISLIQSILFFGVASFLDSTFFSINLLLGIVVSLFISTLFIGLGILFGSLCNEKSIGGISSIIIMCQSILSGMWFPTNAMSKAIIKVMDILPFKASTSLLQNVCSGDFNNTFKYIINIMIYILLIYSLGIFVYSKKMKKN